MSYTLIVHRTLLHPKLRELLAEYEGAENGYKYSSPIGFVQFVASDDTMLGKPWSRTPFPNGLVLNAELVSKDGSSSFELLKFRCLDWKVCDTNLSDAPNINWDAFKECVLRKLGKGEERDTAHDIAFAKMFTWRPQPPHIFEECKQLGYEDLEAMNEQLAHQLTDGQYPAPAKFDANDFASNLVIDGFDDFLLNEDGTSKSAQVWEHHLTPPMIDMVRHIKILRIGGSIYKVTRCYSCDSFRYEFNLIEKESILEL